MFEYDQDLHDLMYYINQRSDLNYGQCLKTALDTIYTKDPYYDDEGYLLTPPIDTINGVDIHIRISRDDFKGMHSVLYGTGYSSVHTEYVFIKDGKEVRSYYLSKGIYCRSLRMSLKKCIDDVLPL